ncbi:MAG TPA: archaemetzincin [Terriglobales bacterium]|nr:archaemetzincin [Terriglobales bacterium]
MSVIHLLPVGPPDGAVLERLRRGLQEILRVDCQLLPDSLDPKPFLHAQRQQYHSTQILSALSGLLPNGCWRLLGVTSVDLYMPILTFVFGEAQLTGRCCVVSWRRLTQGFYGLPNDPELFAARLLKESVHELGHTLGLTHCQDYGCVMAASHSVEWIDIKGADFCPACHEHALSVIPARRRFGIF